MSERSVIISSIPNNENYHPMVCKDDFFQVFLDDVNITKKYMMTTVNENEGFIQFYVTDEKNCVKLDDELRPVEDRIYGNIMIKFKK
jgi:hypothetical protein